MNSPTSSHRAADRQVPRRPNPSRSPHPYHRRGASLLTSDISGTLDALTDISNPSQAASVAHSPHLSSESGTEADDERQTGFLKRLPAPPLRGRKGLRGAAPAERTPAVSPFPTLSILTSDDRSFPFQRTQVGSGRDQSNDDQLAVARAKYLNRKRAELTRRITEAVVFLLIGLVACIKQDISAKLREWQHEVGSHIAVTALLYVAYPFRLSFRAYHNRQSIIQSLQFGFHVPSKFDPGTLIYPPFLPMLVALSLLSRSLTFVVPNLVLGLSSLPAKIVPWSRDMSISPVHWIISLIPLFVSQNLGGKFRSASPFGLKAGDDTLPLVNCISLLYPLHALTTQCIAFVTSTSLDPAESQLLSAALINLLLFSASPQARILQALMWLGGVLLFTTCYKVLYWEVALARVPSWRFRKRSHQGRANQSIVDRFDVILCQKISNFVGGRSKFSPSRSDDEDEPPIRQKPIDRSQTLKLVTDKLPNGYQKGLPISAVEAHGQNDTILGQSNKNFGFNSGSQRRHTFSGLEAIQPAKPTTTSNGRMRRVLSPGRSEFLTLTLAQAQARKWMYAAYVYVTVCGIVLLPIRKYVSVKALTSHEPFGWALGYLLGNVPAFRFWTVSQNLENWIALPERHDRPILTCEYGWVERIRQADLGLANTRLILMAYCIVVLLTGIALVFRLTALVEVDTRRKVFHGMMVAMLLPTVFVDPCFVALALVLILAIFLLLDLFRASQLPPISKPLTIFLAPYVDGRDHRGPVIVSHMFLLIGCAIPLWLSLAGAPRTGENPWSGWDTRERDISMVSGVICVGMGDAAASLVGRRYGRHKWIWRGGKSLEGSLAFAVAVTLGLVTSFAWLRVGGWVKHDSTSVLTVIAKASVAASGASLTEAVLTSCNDNVVVPIVLWLLVRGLGL